MNLDEYLNENLDDILDNPDKYVSTNKPNKPNKLNKANKKVLINESNNDIIEIEKNVKRTEENMDIDDLDEKEYLEYNQEYFDTSNEYYDINYYNEDEDEEDDDDDDDDETNDEDKEQYDKYKKIISDEEPTEDNCEDDIIDELYEKMHKSLHPIIEDNEILETNNQSIQDLLVHTNTNTNTNLNLLSSDNGEYFLNLMNIFIKYYNNKFDKLEHFFSNVKDLDKGTTSQMELFFDAITEFKMFSECMKINTNEAMEHLYKETEPEKISKLFEKWDRQIYMFEFDELKLFSPSLIICLNYIYEKNILNDSWNIYNLRDN